jgi:hypothetical protein
MRTRLAQGRLLRIGFLSWPSVTPDAARSKHSAQLHQKACRYALRPWTIKQVFRVDRCPERSINLACFSGANSIPVRESNPRPHGGSDSGFGGYVIFGGRVP